MTLRGRLRRLAVASAALGAGGLLYAREVEPRRLEVVRPELTLPRLAAEFDGYRVVQIGDLHLDDWSKPARLGRISDLVNAECPDLIVVTGDFASYSAKRLDTEKLVGALGRLSAPDGVLAILGNHDYLTDVDLIRHCIREAGLTELLNGAVTLGRGGSELHVAGVAAATGRFDLQLSGHSHGGQVRVPLLGKAVLPPFSQRYTRGLHEVGGMLLYTNRGLGTVHARLRFGCRPEITVLTLRSPGA